MVTTDSENNLDTFINEFLSKEKNQ
jgi:hypothetical protein